MSEFAYIAQLLDDPSLFRGLDEQAKQKLIDWVISSEQIIIKVPNLTVQLIIRYRCELFGIFLAVKTLVECNRILSRGWVNPQIKNLGELINKSACFTPIDGYILNIDDVAKVSQEGLMDQVLSKIVFKKEEEWLR
jgi:hypothetical protein